MVNLRSKYNIPNDAVLTIAGYSWSWEIYNDSIIG